MRTLIGIMLLCALTTVSPGAPVNLLANGSFEQGTVDAPARWRVESWQGQATAGVDESVAEKDERSLRFHSEAKDGTAVAQQVVPLVQPDQPVRVDGWWRGESLDGLGARVVCRFLGKSGAKLSDANPINKSGTFDWERFEIALTPPTGTANVQVFLELWESAGQAWFDSIALSQELRTVARDELRIGGGAESGDLRVGIIDVRTIGGKMYGPQGIHDALSKVAGVEPVLIADASLYNLSRYDCIIVPEIQDAGSLSQTRIADPNWAWFSDWRAALISYVRAGGGVLLAHDSVGFRFDLEHPLFPDIARGVDRSFRTGVARFTDHPIMQGLEPFECAFTDMISLKAGPAGTVVAFNSGGEPAVVVGESGGGRVVACGLALGIDSLSKEAAPGGPEALLLAQAVTWAAQGRRQPTAVVVSPWLTHVREPAATLPLQVLEFALAPTDSGEARPGFRAWIESEAGPLAQVKAHSTLSSDAPVAEALEFDIEALADGTYPVRMAFGDGAEGRERNEVVAMVVIQSGVARRADGLPKSQFEWRACNCHGPSGLRSVEDIEQMVQHLKEMNFTALLIAGKPPSGRCYWDTEIGTRPEGFDDLDHLKVISEACEKAGLQCLVQFCTFVEGAATDPTDFIKQHPEFAEYHQGQPTELSERKGQVFGCPDRPEVRAYELRLIREIVTKYPCVDGISFDYIRYGDDRWCDCEHSKTMQAKFGETHPDLGPNELRRKFAEQQIVSFTWDVRRVLDEVRPGLLLHGYCHPTWANRFPLNYLSFRASAHGDQPGRGGAWPLEKVAGAAKRNVELADDNVDFMRAAPMADTGYTAWAKSPERFRRELRLVYAAGARDIMVYLYSTLRAKPDLREMLAEEFAE